MHYDLFRLLKIAKNLLRYPIVIGKMLPFVPFSYSEPLSLRTKFSGLTFLTKMLEMLHDNLLIDIDLFDAIEKISQSLMQIILLRHRQFRQKCTCKLNVYIFYLRSALDIIHDDRCDKKNKTKKTKTKQTKKKPTHTKNY